MNRPLSIKTEAPKRIVLYPLNWIQELSALVGLFCILYLFRSSAFNNFTTQFLGGAEYDSGLYLWLIKTNLENFKLWYEYFGENFVNFLLLDADTPRTIPHWFGSRAFYPYGSTVGFSDNFIFPSLIVGALQILGLSFTPSWNTLIIGSNLLNGYLTYRLCRRISGVYMTSILAGASFMTWSWFGEHLGHPQLQLAFFIPLILLAFCNFMDKPSIKISFQIGVIILLAFLSTVYYAIFISIILIVSFVATLFIRSNLKDFRYLLCFGGGLVLTLPLLYSFVFPYLDVQEAFGKRHLFEPYFFSATGLSYLSAPIYNWIYGQFNSQLSHSEGHLFPGILLIVSLVALLWRSIERKNDLYLVLALLTTLILTGFMTEQVDPDGSLFKKSTLFNYAAAIVSWMTFLITSIWFYCKRFDENGSFNFTSLVILILIIFFILSLGPLGNSAENEPTLGIYTLFYNYFPGFSSARAIGRAGIVVAFALSLVIGLLGAGLPAMNFKVAMLKIGALIIVLIENFNPVFPLGAQPEKPHIFYELEKVSDSHDAIMVLPYATSLRQKDMQIASWHQFARINVNYMSWSEDIKGALVNGYSGQQTWFMREYPRKLLNFPDKRSITALQTITNLKYILIISNKIPGFSSENFAREVNRLNEDLEIINRDTDNNFLLRLKGSIEIDKNTIILAPPDHGRKNKLTFQLRANPISEVSSSQVRIIDSETKQIIGNVSVLHDGNTRELNLWPEPTKNRVRVRRFKVEIVEDSSHSDSVRSRIKVFLRDPTFAVY